MFSKKVEELEGLSMPRWFWHSLCPRCRSGTDNVSFKCFPQMAIPQRHWRYPACGANVPAKKILLRMEKNSGCVKQFDQHGRIYLRFLPIRQLYWPASVSTSCRGSDYWGGSWQSSCCYYFRFAADGNFRSQSASPPQWSSFVVSSLLGRSLNIISVGFAAVWW